MVLAIFILFGNIFDQVGIFICVCSFPYFYIRLLLLSSKIYLKVLFKKHNLTTLLNTII